MTGTSLDAVLADEPATDKPAEQVEQVERETGVDESVSPTEEEPQAQDDPIEKHRKGLEAGIAAERQKRQAIERERDEMRTRLQQLERQSAPKPQPTESVERPKRDAYESQEDYEDALLVGFPAGFWTRCRLRCRDQSRVGPIPGSANAASATV